MTNGFRRAKQGPNINQGDRVGSPFNYSLFGLHVRSDVELPEVPSNAASGEPDVRIEIAPVPELRAGDVRFTIEGVATYWIGQGSRIILQPDPGALERNVRLYLLGSAMGALLHQRGILPLHANAIELDGRAVAIMGPSGAGKSTLAAAFHDRGSRVMADDICPIVFGPDDRPCVSRGIPRLRLWADALAASGREPQAFPRSLADDDEYQKYDVALAADGAAGSVELAAIYVLADGEKFGIAVIQGIEAAEEIFAHTYRGHMVKIAGSAEAHWAACVRLIRATPVFRLTRPRDLAQLDQLCAEISAHACSLA